MLDIGPQAETPGITHSGACHRPTDSHFFYKASSGCLIEPDVQYRHASDIFSHLGVESVQECATKAYCSYTEPEANFWTYNLKTKKCSIKTSNLDRIKSQDHVSGSVYCAARLQGLKASNCIKLRFLKPPTTPTRPPAPPADLSEYLSKLGKSKTIAKKSPGTLLKIYF